MPIKPGYVKDIGAELIEAYPDAFGHDFEHNKNAVTELTDVESKQVRNRIAGYITRQHRPKDEDE